MTRPAARRNRAGPPDLTALRAAGSRPTLAEAQRVLKQVWGYPDFRAEQARALEPLFAGRDVLAVFPTGGGKSLCYQVPALLLEGVTVVVSPLISLMKDQIDALHALSVPARYLNSTLRVDEADEVLALLERDELRLLYVSPERFDSEEFTRVMARVKVALYAIDEAHCVSEWGHDFRPAYKRLGQRRKLFPDAPVVAVTATATPRVRRDIVEYLALRDPAVQVGGFDRPNLHWAAAAAADEPAKVAATFRALRGLSGSAIVYVSTQDSAMQVAHDLADGGHTADAYHAGLSDSRRKGVQESFMGGRTRIVVATNAFGMGIDKPDIRLVLHYTIPATMEALYQEAGRGGRDGEPARSLLLHGPTDRRTHEYLIKQAHPSRAMVEDIYRALQGCSDSAGLLAQPAERIAEALKLRSPRQVYAGLRVLADAGVILYTASQRQTLHVKLQVEPARVTAVLSGPERAGDLATLRGLWKLMGGDALFRGASVRRSAIERLPGGITATTAALERLANDGLLAWSMDAVGTRLLATATPANRLPIEWGEIDAQRRGEIAKLDSVEAYATRRGCRRRALLDYFRDDSPVTCGGCDFCDRNRRA